MKPEILFANIGRYVQRHEIECPKCRSVKHNPGMDIPEYYTSISIRFEAIGELAYPGRGERMIVYYGICPACKQAYILFSEVYLYVPKIR
jgi:hypothetical protein